MTITKALMVIISTQNKTIRVLDLKHSNSRMPSVLSRTIIFPCLKEGLLKLKIQETPFSSLRNQSKSAMINILLRILTNINKEKIMYNRIRERKSCLMILTPMGRTMIMRTMKLIIKAILLTKKSYSLSNSSNRQKKLQNQML